MWFAFGDEAEFGYAFPPTGETWPIPLFASSSMRTTAGDGEGLPLPCPLPVSYGDALPLFPL